MGYSTQKLSKCLDVHVSENQHYLENTSTKTCHTSYQSTYSFDKDLEKERDLLSDSKIVSDLIACLRLKNHQMFRPLQRVDSSISIGRIERRYRSLQTYDTNILYI